MESRKLHGILDIGQGFRRSKETWRYLPAWEQDVILLCKNGDVIDTTISGSRSELARCHVGVFEDSRYYKPGYDDGYKLDHMDFNT